MSEQTPAQIQTRIAELQSELAAAQTTVVDVPAQIAELQQEEVADEVVTPASPVVAPQPITVRRILPTGQFQTPSQGSDE